MPKYRCPEHPDHLTDYLNEPLKNPKCGIISQADCPAHGRILDLTQMVFTPTGITHKNCGMGLQISTCGRTMARL